MIVSKHKNTQTVLFGLQLEMWDTMGISWKNIFFLELWELTSWLFLILKYLAKISEHRFWKIVQKSYVILSSYFGCLPQNCFSFLLIWEKQIFISVWNSSRNILKNLWSKISCSNTKFSQNFHFYHIFFNWLIADFHNFYEFSPHKVFKLSSAHGMY